MWIILLLFALGMIVGFGIRRHDKLLTVTTRTTTGAIWLLLFLMGVSVGTNTTVMNNLHTIGLKALLIAMAALTGSIAVMWFVDKKFFGRKPV